MTEYDFVAVQMKWSIIWATSFLLKQAHCDVKRLKGMFWYTNMIACLCVYREVDHW